LGFLPVAGVVLVYLHAVDRTGMAELVLLKLKSMLMLYKQWVNLDSLFKYGESMNSIVKELETNIYKGGGASFDDFKENATITFGCCTI